MPSAEDVNGIVQAERERVAAEVRAVKARFKLTQAELGIVIGVGQSGMSDRLNAKLPFDVDELVRLCVYFNVPLTIFFRGTSEQDKRESWCSPVLAGVVVAA